MALTTFVAGQVLQAQQLNDSYAAVDWNENVVINGAMQVAQRATSTTTITTTGYYTADRYRATLSALGTWTQSVENDAPTGSGFRKSLKMLCTTADAAPAASDLVRIDQLLEGQNIQIFKKGTTSATTFVLSFWVKSNVTGTFVVGLFDNDNSRQVAATYTVSASATWEKKSITFPADTTGVFDNDNAASLTVQFWLGAGSDNTTGALQTTWGAASTNGATGQTNVAAAINNYWQVTGVQLEPSRESQFLFQDYGTVLAQCQRYYQIPASGSTASPIQKDVVGIGFYMTATTAQTATFYPVEMRTQPTATITNGTSYWTFWALNAFDLCDTVAASNLETNAASFEVTGNVAGTAGAAGQFLVGNANAKIQLSAEL